MSGAMKKSAPPKLSLPRPKADQLPKEVVEKVMASLDMYDLVNASHVCENWKDGCQYSAKKMSEKIMDEEAQREVLRLQPVENWVGALAAWHNGGISAPKNTVKRGGQFVIRRKTFSLPKLTAKPYYKVFHAVGSRVITEGRRGSICFWSLRNGLETALTRSGNTRSVTQVAYAEREEKLFLLREETRFSFVPMPKGGVPSSAEIVLFEGPVTKFALDFPWVALLVGDRLIDVYKIDVNAEEKLSLVGKKEIEMEAKVRDFNLWNGTLMVLQDSGVIANYRIEESSEPIRVFETERITALRHGGLTAMTRSAILFSNRNASELQAHWHMNHANDFWVASMFYGRNLETFNVPHHLQHIGDEHLTYVTMRRRLLVCATSGGRLFIFTYCRRTDKSPNDAFMSDFFRFEKPDAVIRLEKQPIEKVDIGFEGGRVFIFVLFQQSRLFETLVLRGGMNWARDGEAVINRMDGVVEERNDGSDDSEDSD